MEAYQNAALSPEERAKDLLGKMTLQEKVGQLNQRLYGFRIYERQGEEFTLTEEFKEEVERMGGLGVLYGLYRADPWADKDEKTGIVLELSAKAYNIVQKYVIDHSRLGIPMMMSTECPHGHQALGGGLLPVNLAAGATFDPELLSEGYKACGKQLKSGHVDLALMSALDMARDPRWGRSEECYSEDPCLAASMAKAAVTGMQSTGVGSVAKHFCAQGETTGGVNASAARIGERELREIHFPSAKACCEAGVEGIMAAYNEIDGVYCHRNAWLLRDVLRGEMGFDGIVMADGLAVDFLKNTEGDTLHAGVAARKAGVDVSLWDEAFSRLGEAVEQGLLDESEIDESVLKVLKLKFEKGLFEHPYMEENMLTPEEAGIPEVSLSLARESAVLLKNEESVLPLAKKYKKVAVIGYHAADRYCMLGDYTPPVPESECVTVLQGMKQEAPEGVEVSYAMGSEFSEADEDEKAKALALAAKSDVIVAVVGGSSSRFGGAVFDANGAASKGTGSRSMDCGEGMDTAKVHIPAAQEELVAELARLGKPMVTVVIAGRAYCIDDIENASNALLYAFYPGPMGGKAVAEMLYGTKKEEKREMKEKPTKAKKKGRTIRAFKRDISLWLFCVPGVILTFIFSYIPMYGVQIAFRRFNATAGITKSPWVGMYYFERFFNSPYFASTIKNTLILSLYGLVVSFPIPIILALMLNSFRHKRYRKVIQTVTYAPNFISTVVMCGMIILFLSPSVGVINHVLEAIGIPAVNFMAKKAYWRHIYVWTGVWQSTGWSSVIYFAALAGISPELHEAAKVDGATKLQLIRHIDLPLIMPTATILLIMNCGSILSVGFEKAFLLQNNLNASVSEIISTYVYKVGLINNDMSYSSAIGLFNTIVNMVMLIIVNTISDKLSGNSLW